MNQNKQECSFHASLTVVGKSKPLFLHPHISVSSELFETELPTENLEPRLESAILIFGPDVGSALPETSEQDSLSYSKSLPREPNTP